MAADKQTKRIRPAVVPLAAVAAFVGLLPAVLFLGHPRVLLYVAVASVLGAFLYVFVVGIRSFATNSPGVLEYLLGAVGAIFLAALSGIASFLIYAISYGLAWLAMFPAAWLGVQAQIVPASAAEAVTAFYAVAAVFFCAGAELDHLRDQLYPNVAGLKSAFYDLIARKRGRLVGCVVVPMLVLGAALIGLALSLDVGRWIYLLVQVYLVGISAWLWTAGTTVIQASQEVDEIKNLLEAAGFEVVVSPRVGLATVDPLLVNVDLFAHNASRALALQVKTAEQGPAALDWTAASALQASAGRLDSVRSEVGLTPHKIEPLLVLVGVEADASLCEFSDETGFELAQIPYEGWNEIRQAVRPEDRQVLAQRYLGLAVGSDGEGAPGGDQDAAGGRA